MDKEFLVKYYIEERMSTGEIAKLVGCSQVTVYKWVKKFAIPIRSISDAMMGHKLTEGHRKKLRDAMMRPEVRKKIAEKMASLETRRKLSEAAIGEKSYKWKDYGSKRYDDGYVWIKTEDRGWIKQCRYIIEQYLGREIQKGEEVHHINEIRDDDRIENLMLFSSRSAHFRYHRKPSSVRLEEIIFDGRLVFSNE